MKNLNSEETLWVLLPLLVVIGILVASIIFLPNANTETRSKASEPKPNPTLVQQPNSPEVICSSLYDPVCSQGITYANECEAVQAKAPSFSKGECGSNNSSPIQTIPATN